MVKTHVYMASNFTGKQPNLLGNHQNINVQDSGLSPPQGNVKEKWLTIESTLKNLKMWVKSMQRHVISYQKSGDAGFPHKKF